MMTSCCWSKRSRRRYPVTTQTERLVRPISRQSASAVSASRTSLRQSTTSSPPEGSIFASPSRSICPAALIVSRSTSSLARCSARPEGNHSPFQVPTTSARRMEAIVITPPPAPSPGENATPRPRKRGRSSLHDMRMHSPSRQIISYYRASPHFTEEFPSKRIPKCKDYFDRKPPRPQRARRF